MISDQINLKSNLRQQLQLKTPHFQSFNGLEPWQIEYQKSKNYNQAEKINESEIKVEKKLPQVEKFLSTIKNITFSPTSKNRKYKTKEIFPIQSNNQINVNNNKFFNKGFEEQQAVQKTLERKLVHPGTKTQSYHNKKTFPHKFTITSLKKKKQIDTEMIKANQTISVNPYFNSFFGKQEKNQIYNIQNIIKLKQQLKNKKLCNISSLIQETETPYFTSINPNQNIECKAQVNSSSPHTSKNSSEYFTTLKQFPQYPQTYMKREPIKNFFVINHRFKKQKQKQKHIKKNTNLPNHNSIQDNTLKTIFIKTITKKFNYNMAVSTENTNIKHNNSTFL